MSALAHPPRPSSRNSHRQSDEAQFSQIYVLALMAQNKVMRQILRGEVCLRHMVGNTNLIRTLKVAVEGEVHGLESRGKCVRLDTRDSPTPHRNRLQLSDGHHSDEPQKGRGCDAGSHIQQTLPDTCAPTALAYVAILSDKNMARDLCDESYTAIGSTEYTMGCSDIDFEASYHGEAIMP